jgi:hypothetical protein
MASLTSFYIPIVDVSVTEQDIINAFEFADICRISRVDFVEIPDKSNVCHAFVHVNNWYNSNAASLAFWEITNKGSHKFYHSRALFKLNTYWLLLPNKNPVPPTRLNIHQLAFMVIEMEKKINDQQMEMENMKKKIEDLELNRVSISIKTDPQSNRTHTYWQNFEDAEKELYSKV